jgi:hypoxanthine phosphoribosyltransferase
MADPPFPGARLVVPPEAVRDAWLRLARGIQPHIDAGPCVLIGVLVGGIIPLAQISARLHGDFLIDYCHLTRYAGGTGGGEIRWVQQPHLELRGLMVILIDDIFDQGYTLAELRRYCERRGAAGRVLSAVLVRKRHSRPTADIQPDLWGLEVGDEYVFGCGMDYQQRWRHLHAIYALPSGAAMSHATESDWAKSQT